MSIILSDARNKGDLIQEDANEVQPLESGSPDKAEMEAWIAKQIGEALVRTYPGRNWDVGVDATGGLIAIKCPDLDTERGYIIHMKQMNMPQLITRAKHDAGAILERYRVSRGVRFDPTIMETLQRNLKGNVISADAAIARKVN